MNQFSNKYSEDDYKEKCKQIGMEYVGYYKRSPKNNTYIKFICPVHRNKGILESDWSHFKTYSKGCPYCTGRYKTTEEVYKRVGNDTLEFMSEYLGSEKPLTVRCKNCGYIWTTTARSITTEHHGCPKCSMERVHQNRKKTQEDFISDLEKANPNIEVIGEYRGTHKKVLCRCKIDKTEWYAYPANLLNLSAGCPKCNIMPSERKMIDTLIDLGFDITQQYTIDGCENINKLRFDAFDISLNIAFEFNGEQHYYVVDFSGKHPDKAQDDFEKTKIRDKIKEDFCNQHNIILIIIPYWERGNMKEYIISQLKMKGVEIPQK